MDVAEVSVMAERREARQKEGEGGPIGLFTEGEGVVAVKDVCGLLEDLAADKEEVESGPSNHGEPQRQALVPNIG